MEVQGGLGEVGLCESWSGRCRDGGEEEGASVGLDMIARIQPSLCSGILSMFPGSRRITLDVSDAPVLCMPADNVGH